jgi:hypothetical protein
VYEYVLWGDSQDLNNLIELLEAGWKRLKRRIMHHYHSPRPICGGADRNQAV